MRRTTKLSNVPVDVLSSWMESVAERTALQLERRHETVGTAEPEGEQALS